VDSIGEQITERKGRDEEFEELLEKYNVDEIEEKPKHFYSPFCNRWISITGVIILLFCFLALNRFLIEIYAVFKFPAHHIRQFIK
jgi:hypothetical protein